MTDLALSRRRFAQGLGVVVATFARTARSAIGQAPSNLPFSLRNNRKLEGWIRLEPDNSVVIFTGKAELGQGILTALAQIAAEELDVEFDKIQMVSADTTRGPDEQYTFGSQSVGRAKRCRHSRCWRRNPGDSSRCGGAPIRPSGDATEGHGRISRCTGRQAGNVLADCE